MTVSSPQIGVMNTMAPPSVISAAAVRAASTAWKRVRRKVASQSSLSSPGPGAPPGGADNRVDPAEGLDDRTDETRGFPRLGEIAGVGEAARALRLDMGVRPGEVVGSPPADSNGGTFLGEAQGGREADPTRPAGDGDDLARELQVHGASASAGAPRR